MASATLTPEQKHVTEKKPENGRWVCCIDTMNVGDPPTATSIVTTMAQDKDYSVYTTPKPFDWYIFGFSINLSDPDNFRDTLTHVADMWERENLSTKFLSASAVFGQSYQYTPGYLPLQIAHYEIQGIHQAWAWGTINSDQSEIGASFWYDKSRSAQWVGGYVLPQGHQLRFIMQNRCAEDFDDVQICVVGQRWLPWEGESSFKY